MTGMRRVRTCWPLLMLLGCLMITTAAPAGSSAANQPRGPDLVASSAMRIHSLGLDRWDVWVCRSPANSTSTDFQNAVGGRVPITAKRAASRLQNVIARYFRRLSGGRYRQVFRPRQTIFLGRSQGMSACKRKAVRRSAGRDGAVLVSNLAGGGPVHAGADLCADQPSYRKPARACAGKPTRLPGNGRVAQLDAGNLVAALPDGPHLGTAAHELGHALAWPHSFTGRLYVPITEDGETFEVGVPYDDPFDLMGYERLWGTGSWQHPDTGDFRLKGTQVFNRYAAGWIPRKAVKTHRHPSRIYRLVPNGRAGVQMLVIPTAHRRNFVTLEARVRRGLDRLLPAGGVNVHAIDQRASACTVPKFVSFPVCWGESRRQAPLPTRPDSLASLIRNGASMRLGPVTIKNLGRARRGGFLVRVTGHRARLPLIQAEGCMSIPGICGPPAPTG